MTTEEIQKVIDKGGYLIAGTIEMIKPLRVSRNSVYYKDYYWMDGLKSWPDVEQFYNLHFITREATAEEIKQYIK